MQTPLPPRETRMVLPVRQQPVQPVQPEPEQPGLPPSVTTRQERTRERRALVLETPSLAPETTSQTPERAPSLAPPPANPRETLSKSPRETLSVPAVSGVLGIPEAITVPTTPNAPVAMAVALSEYAPSNAPIYAPINTLRVLPIRQPRPYL